MSKLLGRTGGGVLLVTAVLLVPLIVASCGRHDEWLVFRGEGGRGHTRNAMQPPLGLRWKLELQGEEGDGERAFAFNNLVIRDDTMYFGATDGNFYSMDIESGYMNWVFRTGGPVNSVPYVDGENAYFGSNDGHLYAVDRETGEKTWAYEDGRTVQSTTLRHEDWIIFASDGAGTWFLNAEGELEHEIRNPVWHRNSFQVFDDTMYFVQGPPDNQRTLGAYDLETLEHKWVLPDEVMRATWYSFPAVTDDYLFNATTSFSGDHLTYRQYGFDRETGRILWRREHDSDFGEHEPDHLYRYFRDLLNILDYQAPAVWRDRVIHTGGDTMVRALNTETGETEWETQLSRRTSSAPIIAGDYIYLGLFGDDVGQADRADRHERNQMGAGSPRLASTDNPEPDAAPAQEEKPPRLVALSARSGRKVWEAPIEGAILSPPVIAGRWMVFGTDANNVYVLERLLG